MLTIRGMMASFISRLRLNHKLILFILLFALIPVTCLAIIIAWLETNSLRPSLDEPLQSLTCDQLARVHEKTLVVEHFIDQASEQVENDPLFQDRATLSGDSTNSIDRLLKNNLYGSMIGIDLLSSISNNPIQLGNSTSLITDQWKNEWFQLSEKEKTYWQTEENTIFAFKQTKTNEPKTIVAISLPIAFLEDIFKDFPADTGYYLANTQNRLLLSKHSSAGEFPIQDYLNNSSTGNYPIPKNLQTTICSNEAGWKLVMISPLNFAIANNHLMYNILLITLLLVALLLVVFAFLVNHKLMLPIKEISKKIKNLNENGIIDENRLDETLYQGEISEFISGFNQLTKTIKRNRDKDSILEEKRERLDLALQNSKIGIWDWNLNNNHCYFSPTWRKILGHTEESIHNLPTEWFTRVHPEDIEALRSEINNHIEGKTAFFEKEHRLRHLNDSYIWVLARGSIKKDTEGSTKRFIGTLENITNRKSLEARLMVEAMYDTLTGLPNRTYFSEIIEQSLGRIRRRDEYHSAVLFIDLDHFKNINDSFGFNAGDALLLEITRRLKFSLRSMDTISRMSEDSFGILLEEINGLPDTIKITRRLYKEIIKPFNYANNLIYPGTSIGIVMLSRGYQNSAEILRDAESAMFQAKSNGRGKFEIFDKENYSYVLSKIRIENELKLALKDQEISLRYQPIIDSTSNEIVYADTNSVWHHPEKGLVSNEFYNSIAEESGEIIPLNTYILRIACKEAVEWHFDKRTNCILSIPVSSKLLLKPDLTEIVMSALADSNFPTELLQLVITESSKVYNSGIAIQSMVNLSSIGVKFCLADYGVIPSSLEQLKRLPIDAIRISETLTRDLPINKEDAIITESIISLAKILGLQVISTGIDSQEQFDFLREKGISYFSGSYFSHLLDKNEFKAYLAK